MKISIGELLNKKKQCQKNLKYSIEYLYIPGIFYYVRMIEILNFLIHKKGYKC